jgi:pheromone a factor receptor
LEDVGCSVEIYNSALAYVLVYCWPTILGIIAFIYGCEFIIHTLSFSQKLNCNQDLIIRRCAKNYTALRASFSSADTSHYIRLMGLAVVQMLLIIPLSAYNLYDAKGVNPSQGWDAVHADFTHPIQIPASIWRSNLSLAPGIEIERWVIILQAIISFTLFGYARDTRIKYQWALGSLDGFRRRVAPRLPIAGHASTLPDIITVSQASQPGELKPIVRQITFADSRHADVGPATVEPAEPGAHGV